MISPSQFPTLTRGTTSTARGARFTRTTRSERGDAGAPADIGIRFAGARDAEAVGDLQALDGRSLGAGPRLVATLGGVPVAALAVTDGSVVADPFEHTAAVVDLLKVRARQLRGHGGPPVAA